jgi:mannose/fructose-specific phosphotransferase system component IIA
MAKRRLIIASHGEFARGAVDAATLISGEPDCDLEVFCMHLGETPTDFARKLEAELVREPEREFVIMADLFGASICNALYPLTRFPNVKLFTDFNLRLLIEVMADYKEPLGPEDMEVLASNNRECLRALHFTESGEAESEDF